MKEYTIKTPLKHDDKDFTVGDTIKLSETDATPLLAIDAIASIQSNTAKK